MWVSLTWLGKLRGRGRTQYASFLSPLPLSLPLSPPLVLFLPLSLALLSGSVADEKTEGYLCYLNGHRGNWIWWGYPWTKPRNNTRRRICTPSAGTCELGQLALSDNIWLPGSDCCGFTPRKKSTKVLFLSQGVLQKDVDLLREFFWSALYQKSLRKFCTFSEITVENCPIIIYPKYSQVEI